MDSREDIYGDKKMTSIPNSNLPLNNLGLSDQEQANPQQGVQKSKHTFPILAVVLLIGLIVALVIGGISGGGVKLPCH